MVSAISLIMISHLDIRSGEHTDVPTLTGKKVKPSNNSTVCDHLLHCNFLPSFDNLIVLAHENKKYLLEITENLLIMRLGLYRLFDKNSPDFCLKSANFLFPSTC